MKRDVVAFITLQDYDNLGVGYMASVLLENGFRTKIIDLRCNNREILRKISSFRPIIIGFSVVYHAFFQRFAELIIYLRTHCDYAHFTAGGHYATLNTEELFLLIPGLDSIVQYEGEYTILDLAKRIKSDSEWKSVHGIAYRQNGEIVKNPPRPLEKDIDKFPFPYRSPLKKFAFEMPCATLLAGRGCLYNCTFCNTRVFYREAGGPLKRIRKPYKVVEEIQFLNKTRKCYIFLFADDDFPVNPHNHPGWVRAFCNELSNQNLSDMIMWKICCRPDEVDEEKFRLMKKHGLFSVFLGIEDGNDKGLERLNKQVKVQTVSYSIRVLKKLKLCIDYGFMLFQPSTTFRSLRDNLDFLSTAFGDGYSPVTFLKLLPFYKTKVETELQSEGRLKKIGADSDYDFIETNMNSYYRFVTDCFREWLRYPDSVHNLSNLARNYYYVFSRYFGHNAKAQKIKYELTKVIASGNLFLISEMQELSIIFESGSYLNESGELEKHRSLIHEKESFYRRKVYGIIDRLYSLAFRSLLPIVTSDNRYNKI